MLKILAIDPGETTGLAYGKIKDGYMQVKSEQQVLDHLGMYDFLTTSHVDIIVCESFDFRKRAQGVNMYPRELIGIIKLFEQQTSFDKKPVTLHMQKPSEGKSYFTNEKLKEFDVYNIGSDHARDATRHLLQWYTFGPGFKYNKKEFGPWETT